MDSVNPAVPASTWWQRQVSRKADRERLGLGERIGNVIGLIVIFVFALLVRGLEYGVLSGFFTPEFGPTEQLALYGSLVFGMVPPAVRAFTGSRNTGRLMDILGAAVFVVAATYLLIVFPFDFSELVALLPSDVQAEFGWVANDLLRLLLMLAIAVAVVGAVFRTMVFVHVRQELRRRRDLRHPMGYQLP